MKKSVYKNAFYRLIVSRNGFSMQIWIVTAKDLVRFRITLAILH